MLLQHSAAPDGGGDGGGADAGGYGGGGQRAPRTLREYFKRPEALSGRALARKVGVHQSMISMLTRGTRAARGRLAQKIAAATGVPIDHLVLTPAMRKRKQR